MTSAPEKRAVAGGVIDAGKLALEPQVAAHAEAMYPLLCDPLLYAFEGVPPVSIDALRERFTRLESRCSQDGKELWVNWAVRLDTGEIAGYVQATVRTDGSALVAYVLGSRYWGRGIARRAVTAMLGELARSYGVVRVVAILKAANAPSLRLLDRLGFVPVGPDDSILEIVDHDELLMHRAARVPAVVRRFEPADFAEVVSGWHDTNRATYAYNATQRGRTLADAEAFFGNVVVPTCALLVAHADGHAVGVLALEAPWIRQLAVFSKFRREGIGTALLKSARMLSPDELRLFTFRRNRGARHFYRRHGFVTVRFGMSPPPESEPDVEYAWMAMPGDNDRQPGRASRPGQRTSENG
ncbi:MAG: GNAT family N-acetyltransferase [Casimicrobiaceae bacterium]